MRLAYITGVLGTACLLSGAAYAAVAHAPLSAEQPALIQLQKQIQQVASSVPQQLQQLQQVNQKQFAALQLQVQQQVILLQKQIQQVQNNMTTQVVQLQKEIQQLNQTR